MKPRQPRSHAEIAATAIGFAARTFTPDEWEKEKTRLLAIKAKRDFEKAQKAAKADARRATAD